MLSLRADAHQVVHEVAPDGTRAIRQALRKIFRFRRQQDLRGADRRCADEYHPSLIGTALAGIRVDDAHAGHPAFGVVVVEAFDDRVGDDREISGFPRRRFTDLDGIVMMQHRVLESLHNGGQRDGESHRQGFVRR